MKLLSRIEELILLSIFRLKEEAYGVRILDEVIATTKENWLQGAIYGPLARLQKNGYVEAIKGEPTPERGGRAKVYYKLTKDGIEALKKVNEVNSVIWKNIDETELENN